MRHRKRGKRGLKYEHKMIQGLRQILERVQGWPEVGTVIPGEIRRDGKSYGGLWLTVPSETKTGIKALAHGSGAIQEVFITTAGDRLLLAERVKREFGKHD